MSQDSAKSIMAASPLAASSRPKLPATSTVQSELPPILPKMRGGLLALGLLEHEFVGAQPERIVGQFERDAIEAAEPELAHGVENAAWEARAET